MDFIILPDHPEAASVLDGYPDARAVLHHSGRPWLFGDWAENDLALVTAGSNRLAVFGRTRLDIDLAARSIEDLDVVARRTPGCVHLITSVAGRVAAQGSLSTARHLFFARVRGLAIAASNPGLLAKLVGARLDEAALAVRLLAPSAPWPLSQRCVWAGVEAVAVGHRLRIEPDGRADQVRWWQPPPADLPLAEAAEAVRAALVEAVSVRVAGPGAVSADLSGGLDSTSLCFVAAAEKPDLITYHATPLDPANDDSPWAARAAAHLAGGRHRTMSARRGANWFDVDENHYQATDSGEGPPLWGSGSAHLVDLSRAAAGEGSTLHLMGLGGDELFGTVPSYLWSLARKRPLKAIPVIQRHRLLNRWRLRDMLRELADGSDFATSLMACGAKLTEPPPRPPALNLAWVSGTRMPPWATGYAVGLVRDLMAQSAGILPLDSDRTRHQILDSVVREGTLIRQTKRGLISWGVEWDAPMLDDRVVEAALSVRVEARTQRRRFKPLLTTAMRGLVPDDVLGRRSKGEFSAELYQGLRHNRVKFLALCEDLRLAELGLVDVAVLRAALLTPAPESRQVTPFEHTVACESWLRSPMSTTQPAGAP